MPPSRYSNSPEALVVGLARTGNRDAFAELVRRRQSWIRNLMLRCCGDTTLADDLAQKAFLQAWRKIAQLRQPRTFGAWLKRLAVNTWLQHLRRNDALSHTGEQDHDIRADTSGMSIDLDRALAMLPNDVRLCIVLSYHEGMTHPEIAALTRLPQGTVKSHIRRGTQRLQQLLSAYGNTPHAEERR